MNFGLPVDSEMTDVSSQIHGRIMIDTELCYSGSIVGGSSIHRPKLRYEEDQDHIQSITIEDRKNNRTRGPVLGGFGGLDEDGNELSSATKSYSHPDDQINITKLDSLTDQQYMICNAAVWGFVTKLRQWGMRHTHTRASGPSDT